MMQRPPAGAIPSSPQEGISSFPDQIPGQLRIDLYNREEFYDVDEDAYLPHVEPISLIGTPEELLAILVAWLMCEAIDPR